MPVGELMEAWEADAVSRSEQLASTLAQVRSLNDNISALRGELRMARARIYEAEQKLLEEQAKTIAIIDAMIDGVIIADMQGKITNINRAISRQLGNEKKETIGRTPGELFLTGKDRSALRRLKYIGNTNRVCYTKLLYVLH